MEMDFFTPTPQSADFDQYLFLNEPNRTTRQSEKYGHKGKSEWHKSLSGQNGYGLCEASVYRLGSYKHFHTFCPFLGGDYDYEKVAQELYGYLQAGGTTCILDISVKKINLQSNPQVFEPAMNYMEKVS